MTKTLSAFAALLFATTAVAAEQKPEIQRPAARPQAVGVLHTLRTIPEACLRIEGKFTGNAANPYAMSAVQTSPRCSPRAKVEDAIKAKQRLGANGWIFNDLVSVPNASCPSQVAVLRVWRQNFAPQLPKVDGQGRNRIYLKEAVDRAKAGQAGAVPVYAVDLRVEGQGCR